MSFFSSIFKRINKNTTPAANVADEPVQDDLETSLSKPNIEPQKYVASQPSSYTYGQQQTNITLVQGSSDSKPASIEEESNFDMVRGARIADKRLSQTASKSLSKRSDPTTSTLYPKLEKSEIRRLIVEETKLKSMQHLFNEAALLGLTVAPKILNVNTNRKKLDRLKEDARIQVLATKNITRTSSNFEYPFNKELDIGQNYSHIKDYEKIHTFDDVKNHRKKRAGGLIGNTPIFQSYKENFRSYRGQRNDVINCD